MQNRFWILAASLLVSISSLQINDALAQGFHFNNINPVFSGQKAVGKPIHVPVGSGKKYGLIYPKAGDTYETGTYIPINPAPSVRGYNQYLNYYLVDNNHTARLVSTEMNIWCGNDRSQVSFPKDSIEGIQIDTMCNGELIPPGEYSLVISAGPHGESQSAREIAGDIIAQSQKFKLLNNSHTYKPARFFGEISLELDPRLRLPSNARHEFFKKMLCIYLTPADSKKLQIKIYADQSGHFDAVVPEGTYTLLTMVGGSGSDRHAFFMEKHLLLEPTKEQKISFNQGELVQLNYTLQNENAGANFNEGFLRYKILPGQIERTPSRSKAGL